MPIGDGRYQTVAYLSRSGSVCVVSAERHRGGVRGGGGGCPPLADVNRQVARRGGTWFGSAIGADSRSNNFVVDGKEERVRPTPEAFDTPTLKLTYPDGHTRVMRRRHAK